MAAAVATRSPGRRRTHPAGLSQARSRSRPSCTGSTTVTPSPRRSRPEVDAGVPTTQHRPRVPLREQGEVAVAGHQHQRLVVGDVRRGEHRVRALPPLGRDAGRPPPASDPGQPRRVPGDDQALDAGQLGRDQLQPPDVEVVGVDEHLRRRGGAAGLALGHRRPPPVRPVRGLERVADGDELGLRLGQLGVRVGAGDDAAAGEQPQPRPPSTSAQRSAMPNSPSPSAPSQPTGPA